MLHLGYFWDDWFIMWNFHAMGARGVFESLAMDRPIHGYLLGYLIQFLGESPIVWHIVDLLVRYVGAILCWRILSLLWQKHTFENALVVVFIALYPGFTQQPLAVIYILLVFGAMAIWALSTWLMLIAYRYKRYKSILMLFACILIFTHLTLSEYFVGLELIRPVLLGLVFAQTTTLKTRSDWRIWIKEIFLNWLPYLATLIFYLLYRLVFFHSGRQATDSTSIIQQFMANPLAELSHRVASILTDPIKVVILAWIQPLNNFIATYMTSPRIWWGCMGIVSIVALISWAFFLSLKKTDPASEPIEFNWEIQALGLGLCAVLFAGIPFWGIGREVSLGNLGDRYTFPFIFGSALIFTSSLLWIAKNPRNRSMIAALIIGTIAGYHVWNTYLVFQTDWTHQQEFHSQLSWRVPGLQKGTSIWVVKDPSILAMEGDYSLALPVNWIYGIEQHSSAVSYWVFPLTDELLGRTKIFQIGSELSIQRSLRNITFSGNPKQTMVVWFAPPACLKVVDPNQQELWEVLPLPTIAQSLAHTDPIITNSTPVTFPENIFGVQSKNWCYYFEQADLARQSKDWQKVVFWGSQAAQKGLKPSNDSEWIPFIEAYIQLDRYDDASQLIDQIKNGQLATSKILACGLVTRMSIDRDTKNSPIRNRFLQNILYQNQCSLSKQ
jgi:hypothetical protein